MVFSDLFFLFVFIPLFALTYFIGNGIDKSLKKEEQSNLAKNIVLTFFSLVFYAWGEPVIVFLMIGCVAINYIVGRLMDNSVRSKLLLAVGIACNLSILGVFKYADFFVENLSHLGLHLRSPHIGLPIGISFYIFQSISYLVDIYRKDSPVQRNFLNLLLYISMFPQLIAGPIVRYGTVANEIDNRKVNINDFTEGFYRFIRGLGKKVILANQLSEISDIYLTTGYDNLTTLTAWIGLIAFTLQIYFDFSGYSDMAIGIGRCLGFHYNENFNHPYCCNSITDFWRRWHMSLGSFFRDYVYIPLGGNRKHQAVNILVVWFLTGMWHGASWNFIIWGLYFGLIVMLEKYTLLKVKDKIPSVLLHLYSLIIVTIGWGIFYFDDFDKMTGFFQTLFTRPVWDNIIGDALLAKFWLWIVAIILCMPVRTFMADKLEQLTKNQSYIGQGIQLAVQVFISISILIASVALLIGATNNAFIYTRF